MSSCTPFCPTWSLSALTMGANVLPNPPPAALKLPLPPVVQTLRRAPPLAAVSQPLTLAANLSEQRLSLAEAGSGLMLTASAKRAVKRSSAKRAQEGPPRGKTNGDGMLGCQAQLAGSSAGQGRVGATIAVMHTEDRVAGRRMTLGAHAGEMTAAGMLLTKHECLAIAAEAGLRRGGGARQHSIRFTRGLQKGGGKEGRPAEHVSSTFWHSMSTACCRLGVPDLIPPERPRSWHTCCNHIYGKP